MQRATALSRLFRFETVSGLVIVVALVLGFVAANSELAPWYRLVHHMPVHLGLGGLEFREPLIEFINTFLMALFFLLIGLELKRELLEGQLATRGAAALPLFAAIGGMVFPALIYASINVSDPVGIRGWAIPTATDAVLALGVLSLLGRRVPPGLKIFLMALAIFDDIGAVLVIGVFYAQGISAPGLVAAVAATIGLAIIGRSGLEHPVPYLLLGMVLWVAMGKAGIEPALAGIVIGASVPMRARRDGDYSPLRSLERGLQPWVALCVVPLFAFFNAGVRLQGETIETLFEPVSLGVILGLALGKPLGIVSASWLSVKLGLAQRPKGAGWGQLWGVAMLAGIGFTMSLFVAALAFTQPRLLEISRLAILVGSGISAVSGLLLLFMTTRGTGPSANEASASDAAEREGRDS